MKIMLYRIIFFISSALFALAAIGQEQIWHLKDGTISFQSDAPLELIKAKSTKLRGVIDLANRSFSFSIPMRSFEGFNNPLQLEHFNENFMETSVYPSATFSGKIIENFEFVKPGSYEVRTKGKLNIHGVEQERIIKSSILIESSKMTVRSEFTVLLNEHKITIPKILHQKIAEEIKVTVEGVFTQVPKP